MYCMAPCTAYKLGNIEISEKKKHVEHLGHDVRHGYIIL